MVEEAELERHQVLVQAVAQVVLDAERDLAGDDAAHDGQGEAGYSGARDHQHEELQPVAVVGLHRVDRGARQRGDRDGGTHRQDREQARQPDAPLVRAQELQQSKEDRHRAPL